jgi:hypothetical protein
MNNIVKATIATLAISTLVGCASVPQAPKDAKEMAELGEDNLLNVPVDLTPFIDNWKKVKIVSEEDKSAGLFGFGRDGDIGQTTVWTNPENGKMYDADGQPVNEKGERILKNGYVCKVRMIMGNTRFYAKQSFTDSMFTANMGMKDCMLKSSAERHANKVKAVTTTALGGLAFGPAGVVAGIGTATAISAGTYINAIMQDDTL